jgi:hypothetical protein
MEYWRKTKKNQIKRRKTFNLNYYQYDYYYFILLTSTTVVYRF